MKTRIIKTNNYNQFNLFEINRPIKNSHVKKLMLSIQQHGLLEEITVNENYDIIDGQHRYMALKELGYPIYAKIKVGATIDSVLPSNLVRLGWTTENFLHHYAKKGLVDYVRVKEIIDEGRQMSLSTTLEVYSASNGKIDTAFKNGKYKVDVALGNYLTNLLIELEPILYKDAYNQKFVRPFIRMVKNNKNFSMKRFKKQAQKCKINLYTNEADTHRQMIDLYNKKLSEPNRIY